MANSKADAEKFLNAQIEEAKKFIGKVGYNTAFYIESAKSVLAKVQDSKATQADIDSACGFKFVEDQWKVKSEAASGVKVPTTPLIKPVK